MRENLPRVAILAGFPVHLLPGEESDGSGGTYATWLPQLAKCFGESGEFDIHWLTVDRKAKMPRKIRAWNQTFHLLPRWKKSVAMFTAYCAERRMIKRYLRELKPDLVHGWGSEDVYGLAATDWPFQSLVSMQGLLFECIRAGGGGLFLRCQEFFEKRVLSTAKNLSIESDWGKEKLAGRGVKAPVAQIEYGVNPAYFDVKRSAEENANCVFVGSLSRLKGTDTLIRAFSDARLRNVQLHLVGSGPLMPDSDSCPSNITVHGRLPLEGVIEVMRRAWCLVHPTLVDTSPNCVKEARVIGLPVVTTSAGGQRAYINDGVSGFFHEPGDVEGLVRSVLKITESREISVAMGASGREECRAKLDHSRTAASFLSLYRKLIG